MKFFYSNTTNKLNLGYGSVYNEFNLNIWNAEKEAEKQRFIKHREEDEYFRGKYFYHWGQTVIFKHSKNENDNFELEVEVIAYKIIDSQINYNSILNSEDESDKSTHSKFPEAEIKMTSVTFGLIGDAAKEAYKDLSKAEKLLKSSNTLKYLKYIRFAGLTGEGANIYNNQKLV